jgi:hypothetical protein
MPLLAGYFFRRIEHKRLQDSPCMRRTACLTSQDGRTACLTSQDGRIACLSLQDGGKACLTPRIEHCMPFHPGWKIAGLSPQGWGGLHTYSRGRKIACLTSQEDDCMPHVAGLKTAYAPLQVGSLRALTRCIRDCMTRWKNACLRAGNGS